jgi:superfamily II DNA helicase RecQ
MTPETEASLKDYIMECINSFATTCDVELSVVKTKAIDIIYESTNPQHKFDLGKVFLYDKILDIVTSTTKPPKPTTTGTTDKKDYIDPKTLTGDQLKDYEKLKEWRLVKCKGLMIAPYMVFDNKTLSSIAYCKPKTIEELVVIKGVGNKMRAEKYGKEVLKILWEKNET